MRLVAFGRIDHDEAGDDERQIHSTRQDIQVGIAKLAFDTVMDDHRIRCQRTQIPDVVKHAPAPDGRCLSME